MRRFMWDRLLQEQDGTLQAHAQKKEEEEYVRGGEKESESDRETVIR